MDVWNIIFQPTQDLSQTFSRHSPLTLISQFFLLRWLQQEGTEPTKGELRERQRERGGNGERQTEMEKETGKEREIEKKA